jgi:hypothetical protein
MRLIKREAKRQELTPSAYAANVLEEYFIAIEKTQATSTNRAQIERLGLNPDGETNRLSVYKEGK